MAIFTFFSSVLAIENLQNRFPNFLIFSFWFLVFLFGERSPIKKTAIHLVTGYRTCRRCLFQKKASVSEDRTRRPQKTRSSSFYCFFLPFASFSLECSERHHRSIHRSAKFPIRVCPQILANEVFFKFIHRQVHQETEEWEHGEQRSGRPGRQKRV
jgi:hypothetical protein